jgi:hypothetical protein
LVEQGIENPRVGGSIPSPATTLNNCPATVFAVAGFLFFELAFDVVRQLSEVFRRSRLTLLAATCRNSAIQRVGEFLARGDSS